MSERTTPGPWEVVRCVHSRDPEYDCCLEIEPVNQPGKVIAGFILDNLGTAALPVDQQKANAQLIAASPDLLIAAKDAEVILTALIEAMPERFSPDLLTQLEFTRDTCRAAVAKAKGEANT